MGFVNSLDICGTGLTAQKMRIDVLAQNITNIDNTRTAEGGPYRRKMVVFQAMDGGDFSSQLSRARADQKTPGVQVAQIIEDPRPLKPVYDPGHPDADAQGYVMMPNVDKIKEMSDMMSASRAYEANITMINAVKLMANKALEIGR